MEMDDIFKEMERIAKAHQSPDQELELEIQKVINVLRGDQRLSAQDIESIDFVMHHPEKVQWARLPETPDPSDSVTPLPHEIEFIRRMTQSASENTKWGIPSNGYEYLINRRDRTFTLITETERDDKDWHSKTKAILKIIGWRMIDTRSRSAGYCVTHDGWHITLFDFPIDTQSNPNDPGKKFPPGTRGQEAMGAKSGVMVRFGRRTAAAFAKAAAPTFGTGKSMASGMITE